jgi:hypothetical protein
VSNLDTRTDKRGRKQPARKPASSKPAAAPRAAPTEQPKVEQQVSPPTVGGAIAGSASAGIEKRNSQVAAEQPEIAAGRVQPPAPEIEPEKIGEVGLTVGEWQNPISFAFVMATEEQRNEFALRFHKDVSKRASDLNPILSGIGRSVQAVSESAGESAAPEPSSTPAESPRRRRGSNPRPLTAAEMRANEADGQEKLPLPEPAAPAAPAAPASASPGEPEQTAAPAAPADAKPKNDDGLDIPPFLRRKAS